MPTIPDEMDLGGGVLARDNSPRYESRAGLIQAQSLVETAQGLERIRAKKQAHDDQFNYARARNALMQADAAARKSLENDPNWADHEKRYADQMKVAREDAGKNIKGARSRALFDQDVQAD